MPRRRFRDPDPQVRDRNKWDASGQPAIGGLSRIGGAGRGGTSTIVARGGGQPGQVRIEHITLHAEASQTIASGGAGVSWDRIATAPTELRGFETCADTIGSTGAVVAIPIDVTGAGVLEVSIDFGREITGTVSIERIRAGITTVLDHRNGTGDAFTWSPQLPDLRSGDLVRVVVEHSETGTLLWGDPSLIWGASGLTWGGDGAVGIAWGRVQLTVWELSEITSPSAFFFNQVGTFHVDSGGSVSVTYPSDLRSGDVLIAHVVSSEPTVSAPSGWTVAQSGGNTGNVDARNRIEWRAVDEDDRSSTVTWSGSGGSGETHMSVILYLLRGGDDTGPFDGTPSYDEAAAGGATFDLTQSPTESGGVLVMFAANAQGPASHTYTDPMRRRAYEELGTKVAASWAIERDVASGATGNRTVTIADGLPHAFLAAVKKQVA